MMRLPVIMLLIMMPYLTFGQYVEFYTDYKDNKIDYTYRYFIDNPANGLSLDHWESRQGDHVTGRYGLLEPGGLVRTVYYDVDGDSGFRTFIKTRTPGSSQQQYFYHGITQPKVPVVHNNPVAFIQSEKYFNRKT